MEVKYASGIFALQANNTVNWDTDRVISWSQYSKYNKCPKSWELEYVRRQKITDASISLVYGTAMHATIQKYLLTCFTETIKAANELDLNGILKQELKDEYQKRKEEFGEHFSTPEQLAEYYSDGVEILKHIKAKRNVYFSSKNVKLVGVELPLLVSPDPKRPNVKLTQHLDLVFYDTILKRYTIFDIKTSKNGWNDKKKKDKLTTDQLVLYKKYFCDTFAIDPEQVKVVYFILRQKIDPDSLWPIKRVSQFSPSAGKVSMNKLVREFQKFIDDCFTPDGKHIDKNYPATAGPNNYNCRFCVYNDRHDLCDPEKRIPQNKQ